MRRCLKVGDVFRIKDDEIKDDERTWVVVDTRFDGDGSAHNYVFTDGYHVYAEKIYLDWLQDPEYTSGPELIDFWQTGAFTSERMRLPEDVVLVTTMERVVTWRKKS